MQTCAIYPGTFDPITFGHLDLIERAAKMFSHVVIGVAMSRSKQPCFELEHRVQLIEQVIAHLDNVRVVGFSGLLVDLAKQQQATVLIRGVRSTSDFDYELPLANMNRQLYPQLETVFLTPKIDNSYISSSLVKDVAAHGGDIRPFCPEIVAQALMKKFELSYQ